LPSLGLSDDLRKLGTAAGVNQFLGQLSGLSSSYRAMQFDIRKLGFSDLDGVTTMARSLSLSPELMKFGSYQGINLPKSILADLGVITSFTRSLGISPDLATMLQSTREMTRFSAFEGLSEMTRAINNLPIWLKPASLQQTFQPSWEVAAGLGLAGIGRPGLIQDALTAIYAERTPTVGFEVAIQMLQIADSAEDDLTDRIIYVLKTYKAAIIDHIAQSKDWIAQQGVVSILALIVGIASLYETHLSRLDADTQNKLVASASPERDLSKREIAQHLDQIGENVSQLLEEKKVDQDARVLIRMAPLRAKPDAKGTIIRQLYPDDMVRLLEIQGGWARVEVGGFKDEVQQG
jgi:hypothetical protein